MLLPTVDELGGRGEIGADGVENDTVAEPVDDGVENDTVAEPVDDRDDDAVDDEVALRERGDNSTSANDDGTAVSPPEAA